MDKKIRAYRFYLDIDSDSMENAKEKLVDMAGDGGSFGDLDCIELENTYDQFTYKELCKYFGKKELEFEDIEDRFTDYEGYMCKHCGGDVPACKKDMIHHLMKHTEEELQFTEDGDEFEE